MKRATVRRGGAVVALLAMAAGVLVFSAAAGAATPQQIAQDLADGRMDGTYTAQELAEYRKSATVQGYPIPGDQGSAPAGGSGGGSGPLGATGGGALPFTGADLALFVAGGLVLLGVGVGLRVQSRAKS